MPRNTQGNPQTRQHHDARRGELRITPNPAAPPIRSVTPEEPERPIYVGKRKRTYEQISDALSCKKRQKSDEEILEPFSHLGRWIQRGIDLDPDVHMIVKIGLALSESFSGLRGIKSFSACEEDLDEYTDAQQDKMLNMFEEMVDYESDFKALLELIIEHDDQGTFNKLLDELSSKRHDARRDDLGTLKHLIGSFLPPNPHIKGLHPPLTMSRSKTDRGINHPVIAAMFCPRKHLFRMLRELKAEDMSDTLLQDHDVSESESESDDEEEDESDGGVEGDSDEERTDEKGREQDGEEGEQAPQSVRVPQTTTVVKHIQDGGIQLTADGLDAFLYDLRMVTPGKNQKAQLKGLLRGFVPVHVFQAIFHGASSMHEDLSRKARPSIAQIHNLTKVTPKTIAYAITLARFTMSDVESFDLQDADYDLHQLYDHVVQLLGNPESLFAEKTLRWWNRKVFSKKAISGKRIAKKDMVPGASKFGKLVTADASQSQRLARRRQQEEEERQAAERDARAQAIDEDENDTRVRRQQRSELDENEDENDTRVRRRQCSELDEDDTRVRRRRRSELDEGEDEDDTRAQRRQRFELDQDQQGWDGMNGDDGAPQLQGQAEGIQGRGASAESDRTRGGGRHASIGQGGRNSGEPNGESRNGQGQGASVGRGGQESGESGGSQRRSHGTSAGRGGQGHGQSGVRGSSQDRDEDSNQAQGSRGKASGHGSYRGKKRGTGQ
ncbi:hypothetical protein VKT23_012159 [Stygiomarasmius scandens]|uniref:Uncharacterized protein n=1 Tax=Marasmiellus scandens TaxID=2682957 RepID=A0ABR1J7V4_9AGAR